MANTVLVYCYMVPTGYMVPRVRKTGTLMAAVCTSLESMANPV
jgi:hypothetical protein